MAELVAQEAARPKALDARLITPGRVNCEGQLCDLDGTILTRLDGHWSEDAFAAVRGGAQVAFESCGCGGWCKPDWFTGEQLTVVKEPPRRVRGPAPSRIDLWHSPSRRVVFVHGDYAWPGLF